MPVIDFIGRVNQVEPVNLKELGSPRVILVVNSSRMLFNQVPVSLCYVSGLFAKFLNGSRYDTVVRWRKGRRHWKEASRW